MNFLNTDYNFNMLSYVGCFLFIHKINIYLNEIQIYCIKLFILQI